MSPYDTHPFLKCSDDEIKKKFASLINFKDVANLLELSPEHLQYILFKQDKKFLYKEFEIPKKGKGTRKILSPNNSLKILQKKLNYIFSLFYNPKYVVHGFVKGRSIISNAEQHLGKKYVLNFDIEDFFPSINFGRVRGVLISFFGIKPEAASTIANICCYNNVLPQGAPTSPILSNMVCYQLDKELQSLAKQHSCIYTRYADDITFSTTKRVFPKSLAYHNGSNVILGTKIIQCIEQNGFKINNEKTRIRNLNQRLEVTGITVNEKLNVNRDYIKKIRAILRSLELYEIKTAQKIFDEKYKNGSAPILTVVNGMINYVKMVRGEKDDIFGKLARRYNDIVGKEVFKITKNSHELRISHTWVIEVGITVGDEFICEEQGTGFFLKGFGFITNAHVVQGIKTGKYENIYLNRSRYDKEQKEATIIAYDSDRDIAILKVDSMDTREGFDYNLEHSIGQEVTLLGYPNNNPKDSIYESQGHITQYRLHYMPNTYNEQTNQLGMSQERMIISPRIVVGNSGGPVLNSKNEVVGIAAKGHTKLSESAKDDDTAVNAVIPINNIFAIKINEENVEKEEVEL